MSPTTMLLELTVVVAEPETCQMTSTVAALAAVEQTARIKAVRKVSFSARMLNSPPVRLRENRSHTDRTAIANSDL